jgi:hypothetical protein
MRRKRAEIGGIQISVVLHRCEHLQKAEKNHGLKSAGIMLYLTNQEISGGSDMNEQQSREDWFEVFLATTIWLVAARIASIVVASVVVVVCPISVISSVRVVVVCWAIV